MKGEWIRKANGAATVVFTHGINSSVKKCFAAPNGMTWPQLVCEDDCFQDVGVFVFDYFTGINIGSYSINGAANAMHLVLTNEGVLDSPALIFVAHSMGGLVVRRFLVAKQAELHKRRTNIGLVLVASPSIGCGWANLVADLTSFIPHAQRDALKIQEDGGWLDTLNADFRGLKVDNFLSLDGIEMVESRFIKTKLFGFFPRIVPTINGAQFFPNPQIIPDTDHFTISAPESPDKLQHVALRLFTKRFLAANCCKLSESPPNRVERRVQDVQVPLAYIERPSMLDQVRRFLKLENGGQSNLVVLLGRSGVGKTTFMHKRFGELQSKAKLFLDCNADFERPGSLSSIEYLFLDSLTLGHPFLADSWDTFGTAATVISTTDISVARECLARSGVADQSDRIVFCEAFSEVEVGRFLQQICGSNNQELHRSLYEITNGDPLALQISRALLLELKNCDVLAELVPSSSVDEFVLAGFQHWSSMRYDRQLVEKVITCLAVVPYAGMTQATLSAILEKSSEEVRQSLGNLVRLGFVKASSVCNGTAVIYSLPTVLRRALSGNQETELHTQWRTGYLRLLLSGGLSERLSFELIDAWLVGWELLFTVEMEGDSASFDLRYGKHTELINAILQKGKEFRSFVERHMTSLLAGRTKGLDGENCAYVIGLSHLCSKLEPKNSLVAAHIWPGAYNRDGWARGACIGTAAEHWEECGPSGRSTLKKNIQDWLEYALAKSAEELASNLPLKECHWRMSQIDYCAAFGALCRLREWGCALELITSKMYRRVFPNFSLAHITLIISALDSRFGPARRDAIMSFLSLPEDVEYPLAEGVFGLFSEAMRIRAPRLIGLRAHQEKSVLENQVVVQTALTIASQVHAESFRRWLHERFPDRRLVWF